MNKVVRLVAGVLAAFGLVGTASAAADGWVQQKLPPKQAFTARSHAVSCPGATSCMAVGSFLNPSGKQRAVSQLWNGSGWTLKAVPVPSGATKTRLAGVSCLSASECTAVGTYALPPDQFGGARDQNAFVVRWDGAAWTQQTVPLPAGVEKSYLNGVSCTATGGCKAVGGYRSDSVKSAALVEHFNGKSWTFRTPLNPSGAVSSGLNGVSCVGTLCVAVGHSTATDGGLPDRIFAERWNGSSWGLQLIAAPAGATGAALNGVSCTTATACTAVGGFTNDGLYPDTALVERYTTKGWVRQETPAKPSSVLRRQLSGVACSGATSCTAVGPETDTAAGGGAPHVEQWNGSSWAVQPAPKPAASGASFAWLSAISCVAGACTAVGGSSAFGEAADAASSLAERRAAGATDWKIQATPNAAGVVRTDPNDVACSSATSCTAVGSYFSSKARGAYIARWNGTSWAQQTPGVPFGSGRNGDGLNAVSCPSASVCMAVGTYLQANPADPPFTPSRGESQKWNGTGWTSQRLAVPSDIGFNLFVTSVACTSGTACVAVGYYDSAGATKPLVEQYDGSGWTVRSVPVPAGAVRSTLEDVACSSATACTAVGGTTNTVASGSQKPLVLRLGGTSWTAQNPATPATDAQYAAFHSVSCSPTGPCTAVGGYSTTSPYTGDRVLAERWTSASGWTLQDAGNGELYDVSCPLLSSCTAVGGYGHARGWDGASWATKGYVLGYSEGVACTSATACSTVGYEIGAELGVGVIFAGLEYANRTSVPVASRYSSSATSTAPPSGDPALQPVEPGSAAARSPDVVPLG